MLCLDPEFPETFWDSSRVETDLLAKHFVDNRYYTSRPRQMSPADRKDFLECVEIHLRKRADPNMTICVYRVGTTILHRVLNDYDLQSSDLSFVDTLDLIHSEKAQLLWILTPFLQSLLQDDIDIIVLFLRYGVNARDLTRKCRVVAHDEFSAHLVFLSASLKFQSIRSIIKNVDISQDTTLQTRIINDVLRILGIINNALIIRFADLRFINSALIRRIDKVIGRRFTTVPGMVWSCSRTLPTAWCSNVRHRISDAVQGELITTTISLPAICSMCQLVAGHGRDVTAHPIPSSEITLILRHIRETQEYELISDVTGTHQRRHAVKFVPLEIDATMNEATPFEDRSTRSPIAVLLSRYWLANCAKKHITCRDIAPTYNPTRLVEILDEGMIQIVELMPSVQIYAALSHRWSQDEALKTTSSNFAERLLPFRADQLSPILRDSLIAVQSLGYRFLWIDVLCIIQDSEQDWLHEAAEMRHVYSNAAITIAAECTGNETHSEGMFRSRDIRKSRPFPWHQLENHTDEEVESLFRYVDDPKDKQLYIFPDLGKNYHGNRPKGILDTRGWILQEQLLSPRILYYGHQQLYWDCINQSASELSPVGVSFLDDTNSTETWAFRLLRKTIAGKGDPVMLARLIADVWIHVVQNYSVRTLTKASDKLIAIQGVVTALENVLNFPSVAGMWQQDLWKQLIWWASGPPIYEAFESLPFPAPTWSWLSVKGAVSHHHSMRLDKYPIPLNDLAPLPDLRCKITTLRAEPTNISARLDLSAPSFSYTLTANDLREMTWKRGHPGKLNLAPARWMLDRELDLPRDLQCVIIAEDEVAKMTVGMCLVAYDSQPEISKRVGVFLWDALSWQIARQLGKELQIGHFVII